AVRLQAEVLPAVPPAPALAREPLLPEPFAEGLEVHLRVAGPVPVSSEQVRRLDAQTGPDDAALVEEPLHAVLLALVGRRRPAYPFGLGQPPSLPVQTALDGPGQDARQFGLELLR